MSFPSDRLTVGALRKIYPNSFDLPALMTAPEWESAPEYGRGSLEETLGGVIDAERMVASLAYKQVLGLAPSEAEAQRSRDALVDSLAADYVTLGLATGDHHAAQLVRDVEAQAAAQARSRPGQRR